MTTNDRRIERDAFTRGTRVKVSKTGECGEVASTELMLVSFLGLRLFVYVNMDNGVYAEYFARALEILVPLTLSDIPPSEMVDAWEYDDEAFPLPDDLAAEVEEQGREGAEQRERERRIRPYDAR